MTFRETLDAHLAAIRTRDLAGLVATLHPDELTLITSDGRLVREPAEFVSMHRGWFESKSWTLDAEVLAVHESPDLALAVLRLDYRDTPADGPPLRESSLLTLAFRRAGDRWLMVHDQNTPSRSGA